MDHEIPAQVQVEYAHGASWRVFWYPMHFLELTYALDSAHEAAIHAAKLRVELSQSKAEQREYLKNVELARVLDKRMKRKPQDEQVEAKAERSRKRSFEVQDGIVDSQKKPKRVVNDDVNGQLDSVLGHIF
jgi:ESF2/ABP1 family protein